MSRSKSYLEPNSPTYIKLSVNKNKADEQCMNKKQYNLLSSTGAFTEGSPKKWQRTPNSKMIRKSNSKQLLISLSRVNQKSVNNSFLSIDDPFLTSKLHRNLQAKNTQRKNNFQSNILGDLHRYEVESICDKSMINTCQNTNQYYKYWKCKAHEYLDENFRLREENKLLKHQIQQLKEQKFKTDQKIKTQTNIIPQISNREERSFKYLQNIFKNKLTELQNELKQKKIKITHLQDKIIQLNRKIQGEEERTQLIQRLGDQIQTLSEQNISLKKKYQLTQIQQTTQKKQTRPSPNKRKEMSREKGSLRNYNMNNQSYRG